MRKTIEILSRLLLGIALVTSAVMADEKPDTIEQKTRVHRLSSSKRAAYDAFVYANRIPENAEEGETPSDLGGRILGRLANQEGRVLLKLPLGMDRKAYLGYKTFLRDEGQASVGNCMACHSPAEFTDLKSHVVAQGGSPAPTPSLRNLRTRKVDLQKAIRAKITASKAKRSGVAAEVDDAYATMNIAERDIPELVAFLNALNDVPDSEFRNLIVNAKVLDTSEEFEADSSLSGVVNLEGPTPKREPIPLNEESRKLYKTVPLEENMIVSAKGEIANVFVYLKEGLKEMDYPLPRQPAILNQDKSMFRPRVQGVHVGQEFLMKNSDPFIHNVRSLSIENRAFNIAQPPNSPDRDRVFTAGEHAIMIKCDFHPWMEAYLFVMDHPYFAVTDEKGQFKIEGLPAGEYTLAAWHEELGEQEKKITVDATGSLDVSFSFTRPNNEKDLPAGTSETQARQSDRLDQE